MSQLDDDMNRQSENSESLIQNCEPAFNRKNCKGFVWIVGAGPGQYVCLRQYYQLMRVFQKINVGDPDMLTIGGLRSMQQADVILYDCLVTKEVRTNTAIYQTLASEMSCRL